MRNKLLLVLMSAIVMSACSKSEIVDTLDLDHEDVFSLKVGECFDDDGEEDQVDSIPKRACNEPHDNEVYAIYKLTDAEGVPETEEAEKAIDDRCIKEFNTFVNVDYDESQYDFSTLTPTKETWADGDREVVCFAFDSNNEKINHSIKNAGK